MKVICISAKAQHGKDTVANFMKECLEAKGKRVLVTHYADLVKYVCKTFFNWDGQKDEKGRTLLQYVGTDIIREKEPDYWVGFIADMLYFFEDRWDYVLIPDTRFPNEINYLKDAGFDVLYIRVIRENFESSLTEEQQKHPSETALDDYEADVLLYNDSTLDDLRFSVERLTDVLSQLPLQVREGEHAWKVLYEPGEITSIEKSVEILKDNGCGCLFEENNPDRLYGLTFKVTNPALAQYILVGLLNDHLEDFDLGVDIQSIEFGPVGTDKTEIREKLHRAVEEFLG